MTTEIPPELTGVLIGVLATIAVTVLTARLQRITEHARWLREERLNAYADICAASSRLIQHLPAEYEVIRPILLDLNASATRGTIVTDIAHESIATIVRESVELVIADRSNDVAQGDRAANQITEGIVQLRKEARIELKIKPNLWTRARRRLQRRT